MKMDITQLNDDERDELLAQLSFATKATRGKFRSFTETEIALWNAIINTIGIPRDLVDYANKNGITTFRAAAAIMNELIDIAIPGTVRRSLRTAVKERMIRCLADDLRTAGIPVTITTILKNFPRLEYAVDRQFPGYLRAGLLDKIVKRTA